ncbi:MAG: alpha/beta hydrolase-fold protein [Chitinophagaceae bacterium]
MLPIQKTAIAVALLFMSLVPALSFSQSNDSITIGHVKKIQSKILGEERTLYIRTPAKMRVNETYPVLYIMDGEMFTEMASGQVQYLSDAYRIIPSMIVVGIANTDRTRDLTPTHFNLGPDGKEDTSANAFGKRSGGGEKFLQFLKQEVMPYVEKQYQAGPYKTLAGHSLGGLMAVYCMVNHPDYFNAYIAISPSLQWDREVMLQQVADKLNANSISNKFLFFSDANEGTAFHANQLKLDSILKVKNIAGLKYKYIYYPDETHTSEPVKALYDGIRLVYPEWHLTYNNAFRQKVNSTIIKDHYSKLSAMYGYKVIPLQDEITAVARFLRNDPKRINDAIDILQTYIPSYPDAANLPELLGDVYLKAGDTKNALTSYEKALKIDPKNEAVQQKMKQLK